MKTTGIVFPHQLFEDNPLLKSCQRIFLVEEFLFFRQYQFHKQKIAFHRASMKFYESHLKGRGIEVVYIEAGDERADVRKLISFLKMEGLQTLEFIEPMDNWLEKRIAKACGEHSISTKKLGSPMFLNSSEEIKNWFEGKKRFFQTDFYKSQRIKRNLLMEANQPIGGKWTFDDENRLKYPKGKKPPEVKPMPENQFYKEAKGYVAFHFSENYGEINPDFLYPNTFEESRKWLQAFLQTRFYDFGTYEDAMVANELVLHHSLLTPMLNVGLLTPKEVLETTLKFASENEIPINSLEGFVRQIVGWREFIRAVYQLKGSEERTRNFWNFKRKIPASFWNGTTGIEPIDITIKKVLKTGYCHHIERLMVLGNFMLICEFDPEEVYRWFMEMFIDSYDWVMVPNVYGMSQFADGGLMSTKPYISGSNYILKMSDYGSSPFGGGREEAWQEVWDALFWRFMNVHRDFFLKNPRLGMLIRTFDKMPEEKQKAILNKADSFLANLY